MTVQYWRSFDDLETFARSSSDPHLQAWKDYNRRIGADGIFFVWHETFLVNAGGFECVYSNMPRIGFAAAAEHVPARAIARQRVCVSLDQAIRQFLPQPLQNKNFLLYPERVMVLRDFLYKV